MTDSVYVLVYITDRLIEGKRIETVYQSRIDAEEDMTRYQSRYDKNRVKFSIEQIEFCPRKPRMGGL